MVLLGRGTITKLCGCGMETVLLSNGEMLWGDARDRFNNVPTGGTMKLPTSKKNYSMIIVTDRSTGIENVHCIHCGRNYPASIPAELETIECIHCGGLLRRKEWNETQKEDSQKGTN